MKTIKQITALALGCAFLVLALVLMTSDYMDKSVITTLISLIGVFLSLTLGGYLVKYAFEYKEIAKSQTSYNNEAEQAKIIFEQYNEIERLKTDIVNSEEAYHNICEREEKAMDEIARRQNTIDELSKELNEYKNGKLLKTYIVSYIEATNELDKTKKIASEFEALNLELVKTNLEQSRQLEAAREKIEEQRDQISAYSSECLKLEDDDKVDM